MIMVVSYYFLKQYQSFIFTTMTIADQFRIVSFVLTIGALMQLITVCNGHGRLMEPPGRSSAWRVGFKTPTNYDDDQLYCGGLTHQRKNGGKCGVCGDPYGKR